MGHEVADHRVADEREVADRVEDLVADELVLEAQRVVEDAGLAEDDRVVERAAERQAVLPQHLDVLEEREGARRRQLLGERFLGDAQRARLVPQQRVIVADAVGDLEVIRRVERDALVAARQRDRPDDLQVLARRLQPLHARFVNQVDERRRAAVHDRHFRRVQLDDGVVDADADQGREQVLHRLDRDFVDRQPGRELDPRQVVHRGGHFVVAQIGPPETDAEIRDSGFKSEIDLVAGVKPDSDARNLSTKRTLCVH